jgi:hypothetical protein
MALLMVTIEAGRYADFLVESVLEDFQVSRDDLSSENPSDEQGEQCLRVARAVRVVADFLVSPSARGDASNIPLYPDRTESGLRTSFGGTFMGRVPEALRQGAAEPR